MNIFEMPAERKINYLFNLWIALKIIDFVLRLTVASNIDAMLIYNNIGGIAFLIFLYYFISKKRNWARLLTIIVCALAILFTIIAAFKGDAFYQVLLRRDMNSWFENYKYLTMPALVLCTTICLYILTFDKSVKALFRGKNN
jgi:hypothetical protein